MLKAGASNGLRVPITNTQIRSALHRPFCGVRLPLTALMIRAFTVGATSGGQQMRPDAGLPPRSARHSYPFLSIRQQEQQIPLARVRDMRSSAPSVITRRLRR